VSVAAAGRATNAGWADMFDDRRGPYEPWEKVLCVVCATVVVLCLLYLYFLKRNGYLW
jgi:hypothetical protein